MSLSTAQPKYENQIRVFETFQKGETTNQRVMPCVLNLTDGFDDPTLQEKPRDEELPKFDPQKFKPGYTPPVVKKGDQEYNIIVSGVKVTFN